MFMYGSTYFGRAHAHHQELNNCSSSLWFHHLNVVVAVLLAVVGQADRPAGLPDHGLWEIVASSWLIYWKCVMMHGVAKFKSLCPFPIYGAKIYNSTNSVG
jgi:hypothetical protein